MPIKLRSFPTEHNGTLSVTLFNGRKMLDTAVSNYSYGSLQRILRKALAKLPFDPHTASILVLGMGAGSIVQTLRGHFHSNAAITLVELDGEIISVAQKEFGLLDFTGIKIVQADAISFMQINPEHYHLVIVDLFIIDTIPEAFTRDAFLQQLARSLAPGGKLVFNTIRETLPAGVLETMTAMLNSFDVKTRILKKLEGSNDIILGEKTK